MRKWAPAAALACVVVAFACGSSSLNGVKAQAGQLRWVVLFLAVGAVAAAAWSRLRGPAPRTSRGVLAVLVLPGAFLALALLSTFWTVSNRLTFERAVSLAVLFTLAALVAYVTADDSAAQRRALAGLATGACAVGILSLITLALYHGDAVQASSPQTPWRYRGFTENPNTISVLASVALPILVALALTAGREPERLAWIAGALLMLGSTIAAESRGGLIAAALGMCIVVALQVRPWKKTAVVLAGVLLATGGGVYLRELTNPPAPAFVSAVAPAPAPVPAPPTTTRRTTKPFPTGTHGPVKKPTKPLPKNVLPPTPPQETTPLPLRPPALPRAADEIGNPLLSKESTSTVGSGRIAAWKGALHEVAQRPLLGYGFGTEQKVFIDRWYYFDGGTPENSFLGILLQLGAIGLLVVVAFGVALIVAGLRVLRSLDDASRGVVAAGLGVLGAAVGVMLIQSYLYAVGNVATTTVWVALFLLGTIAFDVRKRDAA